MDVGWDANAALRPEPQCRPPHRITPASSTLIDVLVRPGRMCGILLGRCGSRRIARSERSRFSALTSTTRWRSSASVTMRTRRRLSSITATSGLRACRTVASTSQLEGIRCSPPSRPRRIVWLPRSGSSVDFPSTTGRMARGGTSAWESTPATLRIRPPSRPVTRSTVPLASEPLLTAARSFSRQRPPVYSRALCQRMPRSGGSARID